VSKIEGVVHVTSEVQLDAVKAALKERDRQDELWGGPENDDQNSPDAWVGFIEEYADARSRRASKYDFRQRMVIIAALAIAAVEAEDRAS
jgi:hypothetical protein